MKTALLVMVVLAVTAGFSSCKKVCYDCVNKCGSCQNNGFTVVAGCEGDTALNGYSVEAWEVYFESAPFNYDCTIFDGDVQNTCDEDTRDSYDAQGYRCVATE